MVFSLQHYGHMETFFGLSMRVFKVNTISAVNFLLTWIEGQKMTKILAIHYLGFIKNP